MPPSALQPSLQSAAARLNAGDLEEAGRLCASILAEAPRETTALHILGAVRLRQNDPHTAVDLLTRAHRTSPRDGEIMTNLGAAHRAAGAPASAADILKKAVKVAPGSAASHLNYANALAETGDTDKAERHFRRALQIAPAHPAALRGLADLLVRTDRPDSALRLFERLDACIPDDPATLNAIGALRAGAGDDAGAETALRAAHALDPSNAGIAGNLANVLACLYRCDEALALYETALDAAPDEPDTLANMANVCRRRGDAERAAALYERALRFDPDHVEANAGLANCLLARGNFAAGWRRYLRRDSVRLAEASLLREKLPADLTGRRLTVIADQGLGDEIFFLRFAAELRARGAAVAYRPEPRLAPLLARAAIVDEILPPDAARADGETIAVGDLPFLLGTDDDMRPPPSISIPTDPTNEQALRTRLEAFGPPPWVGVTWRAGTANRQRLLFKEAPAEMLAAALPAAATVVAVQRGAATGEIDDFARRLGRPVLDLSGANDDLEDLLALSGLLDTYVAVSNTMVHLRAARGRTSRVLVPVPAEFRWMSSGAESPWFPGCPVYRQSADGGWAAAFARLKNDLER